MNNYYVDIIQLIYVALTSGCLIWLLVEKRRQQEDIRELRQRYCGCAGYESTKRLFNLLEARIKSLEKPKPKGKKSK